MDLIPLSHNYNRYTEGVTVGMMNVSEINF